MRMVKIKKLAIFSIIDYMEPLELLCNSLTLLT